MNDEDAQARIALHVRIDLMIEMIDAPDEDGIVWCDTDPYDVVELPTTTELDDDDDGWYVRAVLISAGIALLVSVLMLLVLVWSIYAVMGVLLWFVVSSVS